MGMNNRLLVPRATGRFLLDRHPGAAVAYSLRRLSSAYTGAVVRVRTSAAGNAEADFTAEEVANGTLASWVGAGNTGTVRTWYDQSGSGNNAGQATANNQPVLVDAGTLVTDGGKPAIDASLASGGFERFVTFSGITSASVFGVAKRTVTISAIHYLLTGTGTGPGVYFGGTFAGVTQAVGVASGVTTFGVGSANSDRQLFAVFTDAASDTVFANGSSATGTVGTLTTITNLGNRIGTLGQSFRGLIQEMVVFADDRFSSLNAITSEMNLHYAVY
jgi:hypothetical protein